MHMSVGACSGQRHWISWTQVPDTCEPPDMGANCSAISSAPVQKMFENILSQHKRDFRIEC